MPDIILWFIIFAAAVVLDLLVGDPPFLPHPVKVIGLVAKAVEGASRTLRLPLGFMGLLGGLSIVAGVGVGVYVLINIPQFGYAIALYLSYAGLALGQLFREGKAAAALLAAGDLEAARSQIALLVSRDVSNMNADDLRKTLAETLSENLSDGFVGPFFYLVVFGPVGMWVYKAVNTLDSMWGYRDERYAKFGWFVAKFDDLLNYVPARITAYVILNAAKVKEYIPRADFFDLLHKSLAEAAEMDSPNAGCPMAAAANALGGEMGGTYVYFGETKEKPRLGKGLGPWDDARLTKLLSLLRFAGTSAAGAMLGVFAVYVAIKLSN